MKNGIRDSKELYYIVEQLRDCFGVDTITLKFFIEDEQIPRAMIEKILHDYRYKKTSEH